MLTKVKVEERTIRMQTGAGVERSVTFPTPIAQAVGFAEVVAVRLEPDPYVLQDRNVFGVPAAVSEVWRVDAGLAGTVCTMLSAAEGRLVASLDDGRDVLVDPATGKLL